MSDTSRTGLFFVEEATWGTTPASALQEVRKTSFTGQPIIEQQQSEEIVSDAQIRDLIKVGEAAQLDLGFELSYGTYDKFLEGLVRAAWPGSPVSVTLATISAASADNSFNDSANGFVTAGFVAGQIIRSSGFTNAANNGYFTVVSVAAGKIVVAGGTLVVEAAAAGRTLRGTPLGNGTTLKSYTLEDTFVNEAGTTHFMSYKGMRVGSLAMQLAPKQRATGSFSFMGKNAISASATVGTGAATAPTTTDVMNSIGDVKTLIEGGAAMTDEVTNLSINVANNLRTRDAVKQAQAVGIGAGQILITGSISIYMENRTLLEKAMNQTESSLAWAIADAAGNAYALHLPRIKYGQPSKPVQGNSGDLILTLPFTALRHATIGKTIYLSRMAA